VDSNPTYSIKVPEGLIKRSNDRSLLTPLQFYYRLKVLKIDGCFNGISTIKVDLSKPALYKNINWLIKLGWLKRDGEKLSLISYDKLFAYFKYDLKIKQNKKVIRRGSFKIFKIASKHINKLLIYITNEEIKLNIARQKHVVKKKLSLIQKKHIGKNIKADLKTTLSVRGISRILGFSSPSMGYKIEIELEKLGLLYIIRRFDKYNLPKVNTLLSL